MIENRVEKKSLNVRSLEKAVLRLRDGFARYRSDEADLLICDGLVKRFAYAYESSHRMLKSYLQWSSVSPERFDTMPFRNLIQSGYEQGLLQGQWADWRSYRNMYVNCSHCHEEEIALQVIAGIPAFLAEATYLLDRIRDSVNP